MDAIILNNMKLVVIFVMLICVKNNPINASEQSEYNSEDKRKNMEESQDEIDKDKEKPIEANNTEMIETAESVVYRPLFVYRRIEHHKRRINMFNAFAG